MNAAASGVSFRVCVFFARQEIADAWGRGDYSQWPGTIREMPVREPAELEFA